MSKYVGFRLGKVHESHVISEYYCGGCGWPVTDHDSFCPECGGAFRECDASNLEAENAKLRDGAAKMAQWYDEELKAALAENAKLRELVADTLMHPREYCEKHGIEYEGWDSVDAHIYARMRELGVEVDE